MEKPCYVHSSPGEKKCEQEDEDIINTSIVTNSHHAIEQPSREAMLSSMESGMIDDAMIKIPRQTNRRNCG